MELVGIIDGEPAKLHVESLGGARFRVTVEDRVYDVDAQKISSSVLSLVHDGHSYEISCLPTKKQNQWEVNLRNQSINLSIADPMSLIAEGGIGGGPKGGATLEAAMPGKVQRILVKEGDVVEAEQGLLVLVAMKMENELGSPSSGTVKQILVREDENVEGGAPLIVIE